MNFDYCLQTKEKIINKRKHSTEINNFHFLVLNYLESWLNLMNISKFLLERRQVGDIWNREPQTWWLSTNARLDTLSLNFLVYWFEIFQNVTQNLLSKNYLNLHFYHAQSSVQKTISKVVTKKKFNFVCKWYDLIFT